MMVVSIALKAALYYTIMLLSGGDNGVWCVCSCIDGADVVDYPWANCGGKVWVTKNCS